MIFKERGYGKKNVLLRIVRWIQVIIKFLFKSTRGKCDICRFVQNMVCVFIITDSFIITEFQKKN